ncbi:energy transducer TonB [Filimonas effusa]|uniref:TonB C-terminal domain-containing protein n=1 Tax=Filimonas effusa TaxID=2508721 RepID=A0A4Q1D4Y9_9BACT|nr:hypothetical protein [Filimonas effusa]RXK82893.1 hypothetical protein ESB13_12245 [Filimonas effusa]
MKPSITYLLLMPCLFLLSARQVNIVPPKFPGGDAAWRKFLIDKVSIDTLDCIPTATVRVILKFHVDSTGKVSAVKQESSECPEFGRRVANAVSNGPLWQPATRDGRRISYDHMVTINTCLYVSEEYFETAWNNSGCDTTLLYPVNSKDTLQAVYVEVARFLWQTYVPKSGQAETQQGELIRIVEKLDNEIRGNAKANWDNQFVLLANSLRDSLIASKSFSKEVENEISNDVNSLTRSNTELYLENDIYNRLTRRVVEWYWRHKEPVPHVKNPKLKR